MNIVPSDVARVLPAALLHATLLAASAQAADFSFGVVPATISPGSAENALHAALDDADGDNLAFVGVIGVKAAGEECSDALLKRRKDIIANAKNGIVVIPAANDWSACKSAGSGVSTVERLNRLRELFFYDEFSLGQSRIPVARQASSIKFRAYAENMRWEIDGIMFVTLNLPANNNNFRSEAGRNAEFEDRQVANREWLRRVFGFASRANSRAVVIFCDANPWAIAPASQSNASARRDGYAETRALLESLSGKFAGKILIVPGSGTRNGGRISWRKNIGVLSPSPGWTRIAVDQDTQEIFSTKAMPVDMTSGR